MSENSELPYPEWQVPAQEVLIESDREKLREKVQSAEGIIFERLRQLEQSRNGHDERDAIHYALSLIKQIKRERLESDQVHL